MPSPNPYNGYPSQFEQWLSTQSTGPYGGVGVQTRELTAAEVQQMQRLQLERDRAHRAAIDSLFKDVSPYKPEQVALPKPEPVDKLKLIEAEHERAHRRFSGEEKSPVAERKTILFNGQEVNPVYFDTVTRPEPVTVRAGEVLYSIDYGVEAVPRVTENFLEPNTAWVTPPAPPEPGQWQVPTGSGAETPF